MCGIVGAIAERNVTAILIEGLKRLEYRGYDSAGLAIIDKHSKLQRIRRTGKVSQLVDAVQQDEEFMGKLGIAHTRWATHGAPTEQNAHPHISHNQVAVVHNGIIENYELLREQLMGLGYEFTSQTDTEVIAHLLHHKLTELGDLTAALKATVKELIGAFGLAAICIQQPDRIVAARSGSPLVIGLGIGENFLASDQLALRQVTDRFIYLEEGDIAEITRQSIKIWNQQGQEVSREITKVQESAEASDKGEYRHFMLKEIYEQPQVIQATLEGHISDQQVNINSFGPQAEQLFSQVKNIQIVACGTSYHVSKENDKIQFVAQGITRVKIKGFLNHKPPYLAEVEYPKKDDVEPSNEIRAYGMAIINAIKELLPLNPLYSEELKNYLNRFSPNEPSPLTDFAATLTTAEADELQKVLATIPILKRMERVLPLLRREVEVARLQNQLSNEVNEKISKNQRDFFLKEQLKIIQRELGISKDDKSADVDEFKSRLINKILPEQAQKRIDEELHKLSLLETGSPEYAVTRNYLDWATALPWGVVGKDKLDLSYAQKVLDKHHTGLADVKDRILEFLAVGTFKGEINGSIILLVGPPGVGKTSIGKSIAEALARPFYRFSLGGMRDEAEIKGHRRTYIGAQPGKLVQALKEVEVMNPVIMASTTNKVSTGFTAA